jgi:hypothetical protein
LNAREILQILCPNCEFSSFGLWKRRLTFHYFIFCSFFSFVKNFKIINDLFYIINNKIYLLSICKILVYFQILRQKVLWQRNLNIQSDAKLLQFSCKNREETNAHAMSIAAIFHLHDAMNCSDEYRMQCAMNIASCKRTFGFDDWKCFEEFWHFFETIAEGSILEWCFTVWMRENTYKAKKKDQTLLTGCLNRVSSRD